MPAQVSLRQRLRSAILLPTALGVALCCVVFVVLQWRSSLSDNEERLRTLAVILAENCASSLAFLDIEDARRVLASLHSETAVRDAMLFDAAGTPFAAFRADANAGPLPATAGAPGVTALDGRLHIFYPVEEAGRHYGTLFIHWDLRPWYREMRTYIVVTLGILSASVVVAVLIGRYLQRDLAEPILSLAETAKEIAGQNYSVRAAVPTTVELETLAHAFNEMLNRLGTEIEATRRAELQLRLVTDATPGLISYIDSERRYRFVNRQYEMWFGVPREKILGRTMTEVLGEAAARRLEPHFERARNGEAVEFEVEVPYREGGTRWIHAHYIPHRASDDRVLGVIVLVLDNTERKRMAASLAQAHAELEQHTRNLEATVEERTARLREVIGELEAFSYSIAHDMRAPLRSMQGFSRLLMEEHAAQLNDEAKSFLRRIVASADRLDQLIQDVLNYSRVVRGDLQLEEVNTRKLFEEIIATYPNLQPPNADIVFETEMPPLWANAAALTQVISNLLGNAVKFVKPGTRPRVRISAERFTPADPGDTAEWVRISIADNGIGIPKDAHHRLFAMFQRLHRPELYEGTGMGLAIVRKAIERMGGRLGVDSEPGRGSWFWFELKSKET